MTKSIEMREKIREMLLKHMDEDAASDLMLKIDDLSSEAYNLGYDEAYSIGYDEGWCAGTDGW